MPARELPAEARAASAGLAPGPGDALVVTDVQNDFVTGTLAVPGAAAIVAPLNRAIEAFHARGLPVIAIRDWHPPGHCSFAATGGPWPEHCVQGSRGAEFVAGLRLCPGALLVSKGTDPDAEAYSGFKGTMLAEALRARGARRLFIGGLATDYCVLNTVHDAVAAGFAVVVLSDGIRAVDVHPGDGAKAEDEMCRAGARFACTDEVIGASAAPGR
jgi:nicotinamidase/pyrazinamidase